MYKPTAPDGQRAITLPLLTRSVRSLVLPVHFRAGRFLVHDHVVNITPDVTGRLFRSGRRRSTRHDHRMRYLYLNRIRSLV